MKNEKIHAWGDPTPLKGFYSRLVVDEDALGP